MYNLFLVIPESLVQTNLIFSLFGIQWKTYKKQNLLFIVIFALLTLLLFQLQVQFELRVLMSIFIHTVLMKWLYPFSWNIIFLISITRTAIQNIMGIISIYMLQYTNMDLLVTWTIDVTILAIGIFLSVKKLAFFKWFMDHQKQYKQYLILITTLFLFHDDLINLLLIRTIGNPLETSLDVVIVYVLTDLFMAIIIYIIFSFGKKLELKTIDTTERVYFQNLEDFIASVRSQRHDYLNHLQVIGGLLQREEYEDVKQYLNELNTEIRGHEFLLQLDHPPLAALLQTKIEITFAQHIDIKVDTKTTIPPLDIKSYELVQIVGNLLDNAIDEEIKAPLHSRSIAVTLNRLYDSILVISVQNANSWITPENLKKIFNKGYTTKERHQGIGLATARRLVTKYQGLIEVESGKTVGTTFLVFIPYTESKKGLNHVLPGRRSGR